MSNKILLIAFHYPPAHQSSGVQRVLKFSQYLPSFNWQPTVLTVSEKAHKTVNYDQIGDIPNSVKVVRAFALDSARHLSIRNRYLKILAIPDQWISWWYAGVREGMKIIKEEKPDFIYSTYPISTAHMIAHTLHRKCKIKWIADFRDPMLEGDYPSGWLKRRSFKWIEKRTIKYSTISIFTTQGTKELYEKRYPAFNRGKFRVIENGYDEELFARAESAISVEDKKRDEIILLHSGVLYPSERDPLPFFDAVLNLKKSNFFQNSSVKIILRASGHENIYKHELNKRDIEDVVFLKKSISYQHALKEMLTANALLIFQAANCNNQIPAKMYEYFRANKPILALTDKDSSTAKLMFKENTGYVVQIDNVTEIESGIRSLIVNLKSGKTKRFNKNQLQKYSRFSRTQELANLLDSII